MGPDDRELFEHALLRALRLRCDELKSVFAASSDHWGFEDPVYRLYHQSFKLYSVQAQTQTIVDLLASLLPERTLNAWFLEIVGEGIGKRFTAEDNADWLRVTRPVLEAFSTPDSFWRWRFVTPTSTNLHARCRAAMRRFFTRTVFAEIRVTAGVLSRVASHSPRPRRLTNISPFA